MDITHEIMGVNPKYEKKASVNIEKIMDDPKESCVENIMHDIDGLGNGKQVRYLREAIEQQIRRAWNGGYFVGVREESEHQAEACRDISWFMMQTVAEYNADELQAAFGYDHLADAIERLTYDEFYDMYEDYEDRKREEAKKIHVGDEITWIQINTSLLTGATIYKCGIVTEILPTEYKVLTADRLHGFTYVTVRKNSPSLSKTGQHFDDIKTS